MARGSSERADSAPPVDESANLLPAGVMLAAVLAILVLGAMLRVDLSSAPGEIAAGVPVTSPTGVEESGEVREPGAVVPESHRKETRSAAPAPLPRAVAGPGLDPEARARADLERLSRNRAGWTVQLMILCDRDNVRELLGSAAEKGRLFVLPFDYRGRACYRVCWGRYPDEERARRAADLPDSLRARMTGQPVGKRIADVTP